MAKDRFGHGNEESNYKPDKEFLKSFVDAIGVWESKGKTPNEEWLDVVMQVNPADYAGFSGGEDFAEEIQRIHRDYTHLDRYQDTHLKYIHYINDDGWGWDEGNQARQSGQSFKDRFGFGPDIVLNK